MQFDQYVLNQAVANPLWDLVHEYLPVALAGGRPPYRLDPAEALQLTQRLLGVPEGDRPYPLLRTARGPGGLGVRNVVVIQIEGLGTSLLEHDTADGPVMPFVRSLAAGGLYFPSVYQSFPTTDGGVFATLTGFHWTHALGGRGVRGDRLAESAVGGYSGSLPRLLAEPSYRHYAFSGFRHRTEDFTSFTRNQGYRTAGFEALIAQLGPRAERDSGPLGIHDGPLLQAAATTLVSSRGPFTAHVMTTTSHAPWQVPAGAPAPLGQGPVGTFRYVDDSIRSFVERLQVERADFGDTLLVVTGDHTSITFGSHFLERIRVPLVLAGPPASRARRHWPQRHDGAASQVDVLPTILSLLDGNRLHGGMGWSLLEGRPATAGIISGERTDSFYFKDGFALRYHLRNGRVELLAMTAHDVGPADLSARHPQVAARLTREFLALYETADRLMRENRMFPRDQLESTPRP
jgi:phosphoglycerol transferase MdoB-like AlkP superfamily enzyme